MEQAGKGAGAGCGATAAASGKHLEAFSLEHVLEEKKVVCLEPWSQYLLVGLSGEARSLAPSHGTRAAHAPAATLCPADGTLLLASQRPSPDAGDGDCPPGAPDQPPELRWSVVQSLRGFAAGGVRQLQVAQERGMLLCLAGGLQGRGAGTACRVAGGVGQARLRLEDAWLEGPAGCRCC